MSNHPITDDAVEVAKKAIITTLVTFPERSGALFGYLGDSLEIFGEGFLRDIIEAMHVVYQRGDKCTPAPVMAEMQKAGKPVHGVLELFCDALYLDDLNEADFKGHIAILKENYLLSTHQKGAELASTGGEVVELCEDSLSEATKGVDKEVSWDEIAGMHEVTQEMIEAGEVVEGATFGIWGLDANCRLKTGALTLIGGLKGGGKTLFLLHALHHNLTKEERVPCLLFSLESDKATISKRLICREAEVNSRIYPSSYLQRRDRERVKEALKTLNGMPLTIDDSPNLSTPEILARARAWKHKFGLQNGIVAVDFLQLIRRKRDKGETDASALGNVAYLLSNGAKSLGLTFVATCQLHNAAEGQIPQINHIEGSGGIAQAADLIVMLDVESRREHQHSGTGWEVCDFYIRKNRDGEGNIKIEGQVDLTIGKFRSDNDFE